MAHGGADIRSSGGTDIFSSGGTDILSAIRPGGADILSAIRPPAHIQNGTEHRQVSAHRGKVYLKSAGRHNNLHASSWPRAASG